MAGSEHGSTRSSHRAPDSPAPPSDPAPTADEVVPPPAAGAGGLDNIPEELLTEEQRKQDELDHAGLDVALPGEDQARPPTRHTDQPLE